MTTQTTLDMMIRLGVITADEAEKISATESRWARGDVDHAAITADVAYTEAETRALGIANYSAQGPF